MVNVVVCKVVTIESTGLDKLVLLRWLMRTRELEKEMADYRSEKRKKPHKKKLNNELLWGISVFCFKQQNRYP